MMIQFTHITQVSVIYLKSLSRIKLIQYEKVRFFKGNELKLTQVELHSLFHFKRVVFQNGYWCVGRINRNMHETTFKCKFKRSVQ